MQRSVIEWTSEARIPGCYTWPANHQILTCDKVRSRAMQRKSTRLTLPVRRLTVEETVRCEFGNTRCWRTKPEYYNSTFQHDINREFRTYVSEKLQRRPWTLQPMNVDMWDAPTIVPVTSLFFPLTKKICQQCNDETSTTHLSIPYARRNCA